METVSPFRVFIPKYREGSDGKKITIFYTVEIEKEVGDLKWTVEKRYSQFDDLHNNLKKTHGNLPNLPGKTLFSMKESSDIEKRRQELEKYLQVMAARTDLISNEYFKKFLEIDEHAPEITVTPPKHIGDLQGLVLGVRDFLYEVKEGILFTAISDMSVTSRVDSYLTNMKMPWEKELPPGTLVTVGAIECYIQTGKEEIKFDKLWTKTFQTQVIVMVWDGASSSLIVGKDDGSVTVLRVSADVNYIKYDEYLTVNKHHEKRIMGIHYDPITEYVYTIGEDKRFKVFDLSHNVTVSDLTVGNALLSCLNGDKENKRAFISNRSGQIFIYDISQKNPSLVHTIQAHGKGSVRGLYYDPIKNYLFSANYDDGTIAIIDLQKPGKEKYAAVTAMFHGKKDVRCIVWSHGRYELYSGGEDGTLTFWDASKVSPVYAMKAHTEGICKLQWIENQSILMTAGKDKKLRFYKLPDEWRDKKLEAEVMKSSKANKQKESLKKFQEYQQKKAEDSDEDDLAGWHK